MTNLYQADPNLWYEKTAKTLRNKNIEQLDWEIIAEEIEDMGRSEKRALDSYVQRLLEHLLKLELWSSEVDRCQRGWEAEVRNLRNQISRIIKRNPSLKDYLMKEYQQNFAFAKDRMQGYFDVPVDRLIPIEKAIAQGK